MYILKSVQILAVFHIQYNFSIPKEAGARPPDLDRIYDAVIMVIACN